MLNFLNCNGCPKFCLSIACRNYYTTLLFNLLETSSSLPNIKHFFFPPIFHSDSSVNLWDSLTENKCCCLLTSQIWSQVQRLNAASSHKQQWQSTKKRWGDKDPYHCWPLSPSDRSTLYLNKMCSTTLALFLWGKLSPPPNPHDNLLKLCTAISPLSDFRLQRGERQLAHEPRTHLYWMLTAAA